MSRPLRFLSLFSGIEAASVAWTPLGWECVAVAEIEPFPCAVLKHRFPSIPNLGDITKITQEQIAALGQIDIVIFGAPCQDLSNAGLRKGFKNADGTFTRSGLFFAAVQIAEWARPRWTVYENVFGMFSSSEGRDFASVLGEMAGTEFDVPAEGWRNSGMALGPQGLVEWATLDAQFVRVECHPRAVPQRRRRVFVIRDSGDWQSRPPLLLEPAGLRGDSPPSREAGQRTSGTLAARAGAGGGLGTDFDLAGGQSAELRADTGEIIECGPIVPQAMSSKWSRGSSGPAGDETANLLAVSTTSPPVPRAILGKANSSHREDAETYIAHTLKGEGFDASEDGTGRATPVVVVTEPQGVALRGREGGGTAELTGSIATALRASQGGSDKPHVLCFHPTQDPIPSEDGSSHARACGSTHGQASVAIAFQTVQYRAQVRRLVPRECEKLQGFPPDWTQIPWSGWRSMDSSETPESCEEQGLEVKQGKTGKWRVRDADGPRYRAIGNSIAINVLRHIGDRIEMMEKISIDAIRRDV